MENNFYIAKHLHLEVNLDGVIMFIFMFPAKKNYSSENGFVFIRMCILRACYGIFCPYLINRTSADVSYKNVKNLVNKLVFQLILKDVT